MGAREILCAVRVAYWIAGQEVGTSKDLLSPPAFIAPTILGISDSALRFVAMYSFYCRPACEDKYIVVCGHISSMTADMIVCEDT